MGLVKQRKAGEIKVISLHLSSATQMLSLCSQMLEWRQLVVQVSGNGSNGIATLKESLSSKAQAGAAFSVADALDAALCVEGMGGLMVSYAQQVICGKCCIAYKSE